MAMAKATRMAHMHGIQKQRGSRAKENKVVVRCQEKADGVVRKEGALAAATWAVLTAAVAWNTPQEAMAIGITDQQSYLSSMGSVSVESLQPQDKGKKVTKAEKPKPDTKTKAKAGVADEPATTKKGKISYAKPEAKIDTKVPEPKRETKKETKAQPKPKPTPAPAKVKADPPAQAMGETAPKAKVEAPSVTAPAIPSLEMPKASSSKATKALAVAAAEVLAAAAAAAAIKGLLA
eukprot:jgi/Pico_ML_1/51158/g2239.t1